MVVLLLRFFAFRIGNKKYDLCSISTNLKTFINVDRIGFNRVAFQFQTLFLRQFVCLLIDYMMVGSKSWIIVKKKCLLFLLVVLFCANRGESKCVKGNCIDGKGTFKEEGNVYRGSFLDGKPHGHGKIVWDGDKTSYEGTWEHGLRKKGKYTFPSGDYYNGQWSRNKQHGRGVYVSLDSYYKGEWKDGNRHGVGTVKFKNDKTVFTGKYKNGIRHGCGVTKRPGWIYGEWIIERLYRDGNEVASCPEKGCCKSQLLKGSNQSGRDGM